MIDVYFCPLQVEGGGIKGENRFQPQQAVLCSGTELKHWYLDIVLTGQLRGRDTPRFSEQRGPRIALLAQKILVCSEVDLCGY